MQDSDIDVLHALNEAAVPAVNSVDRAELARLIELSDATFVATREGVPVGFVLTLRPGHDYQSENYRFFSSRGTDFVYVDRIAVADSERNSGVGAALYGAVFDYARAEGATEVSCEVNLDPPNPGSSRFHRRLGFSPVGTQVTKGGDYTVELLIAGVRDA